MTSQKQDMNIGCVIQARMGSHRLPGKSMMDLEGRPMVARVLERALCAKRPDLFVLAIPDSAQNDCLADVAQEFGIAVLRGSEDDVLARYAMATREWNLTHIVRIPADNPCPEPWVIDATVDYHLGSDHDLTTSYPDVLNTGFPNGIGCEVYNREVLLDADERFHEEHRREHPHKCFYENTDRYKIGILPCPEEIARPDVILHVNTRDDFNRMARLYADIFSKKPDFDIHTVIDWWDQNERKVG